MTPIKTEDEIKRMRESGRMLAAVLSYLKKSLEIGMSTQDLADMAKHELHALGGQPAFLGYNGFPDVLCISLNDEVVHGIPSPNRIIEGGDIVSMDFGVNYKGMITDSAISVVAGKVANKEISKLIDTTRESMLAGIGVIHDKVRVGDIAAAVQEVLETGKYGIVRDLVGHGVGHSLHEGPDIPNYGKVGTGHVLHAGMTIAIEPMATLGGHGVYMANDGWTVLTRDGSLSAHFEHTVLITQDGAEILTLREEDRS